MSAAAQHIAILGATGSIGQSSLDVIKNFPDRFRVTYLTANKNIDLLQRQINEFKPKGGVVGDEGNASVIRKFVNGSVEVLSGEEGLEEIVTRDGGATGL